MHVQAVFIPFIFVRMEEKGKILIIDDNKDVLFALNLLLEPYMQKVKVTTQPARIEYFMRTFQPDVVLLDMNFHRDAVSGQEGFEYLGQILEIDPQAVVIFMTAYSDIEKAVKAIKVGATDFISKPWETEKLLATLSSGIRLSHSRKEVGRLREQMKAMKEDDTLPELIGESPAMLKVKDTIYKLVETDANILITGESGTGKDLVARLLRHYSPRQFTTRAAVPMVRSSPLTAEPSPRDLPRVSCSAMRKVPSRMPEDPSRDVWRWLPAVRSFWTRSVTCPCRCNLNC